MMQFAIRIADANDCLGPTSGVGLASGVLAETIGDVRDLDFSTKYGSYGAKNPLLKGKLETCGFNVRSAIGSNQVLIRGASTEQTWERTPSPIGFGGRRSVVETEIAAAPGKRARWSANTTFVRVANPSGKVDVGSGLNLRARLFEGRLITQSSMAWVNKQEGDETQLGLAQRHKVVTRLFELKPQKLKVKAIGQYERVEPGHAGPAASRAADRQETNLGTELEYRGLRFNVARQTRFDNITQQNANTNRWDTWNVGSTFDFTTLGFKGVKIGLAWQRGGAFLDDGTGYSQQDERKSFKVKLQLGKAFSGEFSNQSLQNLGSDGGAGPDTANTLNFNWKRSAGLMSTKANLKIKRWKRRSDSSDGYSLSVGLEAKSKGADDLRLKLGARMKRSSNEHNAYGLSSKLHLYF